jgi:hypothetical protein
VNAINGQANQVKPNVDLGESAILFGGSQALYSGNGVGSFLIGFLLAEEEEFVQPGNGGVRSNNEAFLFPFQTMVEYGAKNFDLKMGRTDIPFTTLVKLPLLREEDLLTFLNPFTNGKVTEESIYANLASFEFNQNNIFFENIHFQHLIDSEVSVSNPWINSLGIGFKYLPAPGREKLDRFQAAGLDYERIFLGDGQNILTGALKIRLNESITDQMDLRLIDVLNWGSDISELKTINDSFAANYNLLALAINFLHEPFGLSGHQISLTGSWRPYLDIKDANEYQVILTGGKRIGEGFDLVSQFSYLNRGPALAALYGGSPTEGKIELGLVFNFEVVFNQHLTPRRRILNYNHQYIPN